MSASVMQGCYNRRLHASLEVLHKREVRLNKRRTQVLPVRIGGATAQAADCKCTQGPRTELGERFTIGDFGALRVVRHHSGLVQSQ